MEIQQADTETENVFLLLKADQIHFLSTEKIQKNKKGTRQFSGAFPISMILLFWGSGHKVRLSPFQPNRGFRFPLNQVQNLLGSDSAHLLLLMGKGNNF